MEQEVLKYIEYLRLEIKVRPQCMMVAMMLKLKFDSAEIKYQHGHFITLIGDNYYDWGGLYTDDVSKFTEFPEGWGDNHVVNNYKAIEEKFLNPV